MKQNGQPLGKIVKKKRTFAILLIDDFSMMCLASFTEPMRICNRYFGTEAFSWRLLSYDGNPTRASNGHEISVDGSFQDIIYGEQLIVMAGLNINPPYVKQVLNCLRWARVNGYGLGGLSLGSYLLARAGVLDGYRCTIHWEARPAFIEEFPDIDCTSNLFEIDRGRMTCSGGVASFDMVLHLVLEDYGYQAIRAIANQFHYERVRPMSESQNSGTTANLRPLPQKLQSSISLMEQHLEDPISMKRLAFEINLSVRQIERMFLRYLGSSPGRYYTGLRLERARELLLYSNIPIIDVAIATGFNSNSYFAHRYREHFGLSPSSVRKAMIEKK